MKKLIVLRNSFLLLLLLGTQLSFAQSCPAPPPPIDKSSLVGAWQGNYTLEGKTYDLKLRIQEKDEKLSAMAALPDLNLPSSEFTAWICRSNELHMRLDLPENRAVKLIGKLQNGMLKGRFVYNKISGVCGVSRERFSLSRTNSSSIKME